jgi:hypothetical protein
MQSPQTLSVVKVKVRRNSNNLQQVPRLEWLQLISRMAASRPGWLSLAVGVLCSARSVL